MHLDDFRLMPSHPRQPAKPDVAINISNPLLGIEISNALQVIDGRGQSHVLSPNGSTIGSPSIVTVGPPAAPMISSTTMTPRKVASTATGCLLSR